jgi:nucleoside-diphosphate-sugar epimerase
MNRKVDSVDERASAPAALPDEAAGRTRGRVLVTGAGGEIGQATTNHLLGLGYRVTALSLSFPQPPDADRVIVGDATVVADVREALRDADAVVHLAAIPHRDLGTPYEVYRTNVTATFNVLSQAGQQGVRRAVIASSVNAFGVPMNPHDVMPAYFPIDEEIPTDIGDWYSLSKQSDELTARMAWRHWGIDVVAMRFPLVKTREVLVSAAAHSREHPERTVREGWAYLDVRDAVRVIEHGLTAELHGAHVVGVSAADTLLDEPTAELLARYAPGVPLRKRIAGREALIDASLAERLLGFVPRHSIHSGEPAPSAAERTDITPLSLGALNA